ncbi:MAG: hypothetical protein A2V88_04830 [Elusimicrobia bacterium RBG_16_66_12]|nr:MAG: hypothetical protein A2V88_04830 [Elusimicrobia bacterium RBG_16_66_12]
MGLAALGLAACGTADKRLIGKQTPVFSLPEKTPAWAGKAFYEENGSLFYRGAVSGRTDMALGVREARAEAEKNLAEEVKQRIRTEFGSMVKGENADGGLGNHVYDLVVKVSENIQISGAKLREQFVQKLEEQTPTGVRYIWDCYALVSVSKADYLEARRTALSGAIAKAREEKNTKAEAFLNEARLKLEGGAPAVVAVEEKR